MGFVKVADDGEVRVVTLARGKANALNFGFVEELAEAVERCHSDPAVRSIVFASAAPRFFSAGFDTTEVFGYDAATMRRFLVAFMDLYEGVLHLPKPVVGALPGHTYAGGAFLALAFDERVAADGAYGFAVNEINLGVILPACVRRMLVSAVGLHQASRMVLTGDSVTSRRALEIGLVDQLVAESDVLSVAVAHAHALASKSSAAYALTKRGLHEAAGHIGASPDRDSVDEFLALWVSPDSVERRQVVAESLKTRSQS
jgi:enoyl-CoA hydratase/carnithine racemase